MWGKATPFGEGEEIAEEGAEEREGDEDEAESLFGAVDGKSVAIVSPGTRFWRTNHAHLTRVTVFPVGLMN